MVIRGIDRKLDYTLDRIDGSFLQTTTVDPGNSYGGTIVVPFNKKTPLVADVAWMDANSCSGFIRLNRSMARWWKLFGDEVYRFNIHRSFWIVDCRS